MVIIRIGINGINHSIKKEIILFLREVAICGAAVIGASAISDRLYFGMWTFPPYQWLTFNITQSLAVFYGTNDWHYYLSQGLPLLLTTYIPFLIHALTLLTFAGYGSPAKEDSGKVSQNSIYNNRTDLLFIIVMMVTTLSLISHKEVRFIYPLLPCLHVLAAPSVLSFFTIRSLQTYEEIDHGRSPGLSPERLSIRRQRVPLLILLFLSNIAIGLYATQVHQRGVIDVLTFLRHEYEESYISKRGQSQESERSGQALHTGYHVNDSNEVFAAFLMPCHSTPWRSHLVYPELQAWALTCEPPIHIPATSPERALYRDEADRFYNDPGLFLKVEMNTTDRRWPKYLVGFEGIESNLAEYCGAEMPGRLLRERWRGFNSHWHDDSRRKGMVVVWEFIDT
jgi:GPI mannosyltransferase 3